MLDILLLQIFLDNRKHFTVESNNAAELVASAARNIESLLGKRAMALEVINISVHML